MYLILSFFNRYDILYVIICYLYAKSWDIMHTFTVLYTRDVYKIIINMKKLY